MAQSSGKKRVVMAALSTFSSAALFFMFLRLLVLSPIAASQFQRLQQQHSHLYCVALPCKENKHVAAAFTFILRRATLASAALILWLLVLSPITASY